MNTKFAALVTGLTMVVTAFSATGAMANTRSTNTSVARLAPHSSALTPLAMAYFCAAHRNECAGGGRAQVALTPDLIEILKNVNSRINSSIRPTRDTADIWSLNPTSGDCEDFALSKRSALIRKGVSAGALRIAYTHTRSGEPHAVLVVRTSSGDYVLDNLTNTVKTLRQSGYNIRTMSGANPTHWQEG